MYVVWVEFNIHDAHTQAFLARVQQQAQDSLALEPQCLVFDVCVDPDDARRVALYEIYADADAFQIHLDSAHFKAFDAEVQPWVANKRVATYLRCQSL